MPQHALALLVGRAPAEWTAPEFTLEEFTLPPQLPQTLPSELAHRRPDIQAAEARLHAATAAVGIATANLYPQISLTASASMQSTVLHSLFDLEQLGRRSDRQLHAAAVQSRRAQGAERAARRSDACIAGRL